MNARGIRYRTLWFVIGFLWGFPAAFGLLYYITDQDTPVALEPKCETIIIHRGGR